MREICIRKAMGSSSRRIVYMFFRETTLLVHTGTLLATPICFAIQSWLQNFAFHIPFNPGIFAGLILGAGFLTLILSLISVGGIAIRASRNNPAESLRYE
ncbi:MAG: ABC transporter permease [Bacteroidales bacterium]